MSEGVAITGMSCLFPGARDLDAYWQNIVDKVDAVSDPPPDAWDRELHYDPEFADADKIYCRRGGYLGSLVRFDALAHGVPPVAVGGEPDQWIALQLARAALADAGATDLPLQTRHRTAIVLGKGTYLNAGNAVAVQRALIVAQTLELIRQLCPELPAAAIERLRDEMKRTLPPIEPETVAGLIPNIIAGRIANRLDLMGPTYTVDAACASSLVAVEHALRYLLDGQCDLALAGGSQLWMPVPTLNVFCRLGALSRSERIRPFDKDADGTLLGEGIGMVVLKRVADARRDGDRIYAVIRSVGVASDGRGVGVMAPRVEGQELALRRAYEQAGVSPRTVGLLEAHGTATPAGDAAEIETLRRVFEERDGELPHCALGSVKSMISHTIPASGIAGIIKLALALHHQILPPTLHCGEPNPKLGLDRTRFYVNTETRPWIHGGPEPRRAAINAFGFGGINAHAILEEPAEDEDRAVGHDRDHLPAWDSEVVLLESDSQGGLRDEALRLAAALDQPRWSLTDLAYSLSLRVGRAEHRVRLAIVATSPADLQAKLQHACERLADPGCQRIKRVSGIYFAAEPLGREGTLAFLFPGEGAQYTGMMGALCAHFPEVRASFDRIDRLYFGHPRGFVPSDRIFPRPAFCEEDRRAAEQRLMEFDSATEAVLTGNDAMHVLLQRLGVRADACLGHSTGEYSAAIAAGVIELKTDDQLGDFTHGLYRHYADAISRQDDVPRAVLLAVAAERERVEAIAREAGGEIHVAIDNAPHQTVLVGEPAAAERARALLRREGLIFEQLPYDRAVHTPLFAPYSDGLGPVHAALPVGPGQVPLYSSMTASPFPSEPGEVHRLLTEMWQRPVEFRAAIERLYADGVRLFVEVGPRGNLTAFVEDILRGRPFCAVPADVQRRSSLTQLNHLVGLLAVHGIELDLEYLFARRAAREIDWQAPGADAAGPSRELELVTGWPALRLSQEVVDEVVDRRLASAPDAATESPQAAAPPVVAGGGSPDLALPAVNGAPPTCDVDEAVRAHLDTMDRFLAVNAEIMQRFLTVAPAAPAGPPRELVEQITIEAPREPALRDHSFGGAVSTTDEELLGLAVMPLTMSLDLLAATAARLAPDLLVTGLRDVVARRWLAFGAERHTVELRAQRLPASGHGERISVELRDLTNDAAGDEAAVEATVLLAAAYPAPPASRALEPASGRESRWQHERIYTEGMFHGPTWQAVTAVRETSARGATASLRVLPTPRLSTPANAPQPVLDAVVLDAAGQVIGLWAAEQLETAPVIFPLRLPALEIYAPRRPPGEAVACRARIELDGDRTIRSDIDLVDTDGALWMRLTGWEDRRFEVAPHLRALLLRSGATAVSSEWSEPIERLAGDRRLQCRRIAAGVPPDGALWTRAWAQRILSRAERERFDALRTPQRRRLEWLGARTAAKEAVAELLNGDCGLDLLPADIEIGVDGQGQPIVGGTWLASLGAWPVVSLAHSDGIAVAVAGLVSSGSPYRLGIDIEHLGARAHGFAAAALNDDERRLLERWPAELVQEWTLRCWCAKEAGAKALGTGLIGGPGAMTVTSIDAGREQITVRPAAVLIAARADVADVDLSVECIRQGALVAATAVYEPARHDLALPLSAREA